MPRNRPGYEANHEPKIAGGHCLFSVAYNDTIIIGRAKRAPHGRYIWDFSYNYILLSYVRRGLCDPFFFFLRRALCAVQSSCTVLFRCACPTHALHGSSYQWRTKGGGGQRVLEHPPAEGQVIDYS